MDKMLPNDITNIINDSLHGPMSHWKMRYNNVLDDIKQFNADNLVSNYFNDDDPRYKDIYIDIMKLWFGFEDK